MDVWSVPTVRSDMSTQTDNPITHPLPLYDWVYSCTLTRYAVGALLTVLLLQPLTPLYAADEEVATETEAADLPADPPVEEPTESEESVADEPEPVPPEDVVTVEDEPEPEPSAATVDEPDTTDATESSDPESISDPSIATGTAASASEAVDVPTSTEVTSAMGSIDSATTSPAAQPPTSSTTPTDAVMEAATNTASATEPVIPDQAKEQSTSGTSTPTGGDDAVTATTTSPQTSSTPTNAVDVDTEVTHDVAESAESDEPSDAAGDSSSASSIHTTTTEPAATTRSSTTSATTTSATSSGQTIVVQRQTLDDPNSISFDRSACINVGDGSFYCGATTGPTTPADNTLFAAPDADGDLELFLTRDGEQVQFTFNQVDDAAPHYDGISESVVWHRLVKDRYQIMSYDLDAETEVQLTDTSVNNMEPTRFGDTTVWQRWVGSNWEIMLHDGEREIQLTDNDIHDIAPSIRGDFIIWTALHEDSQVVTIYDRTTNTFDTIDTAERGGSVANPRFILMYDTLTEQGDVVTQGYDPLTGDIIPLGALPTELPDELPDSDQTGETRALIQSKSPTGRDEHVEHDDTPTSPPLDSNPPLENASSTATSSATLVVPTAGASSTDTALADQSASAATTTATNTIPDLVIPPSTASTTE